MGVVQAQIQPGEEDLSTDLDRRYDKQPVEASYQGQRLFCPQTGPESEGQFCYQYGGESGSELDALRSAATGGVLRWEDSVG